MTFMTKGISGFFFVTVGVIVFGGGCGSGGGISTELIFSAASKTAPKITPSTVSLYSNSNWESGSVLFEIYNLIREYVNERDNGKIDGSNMYMALFTASWQVSKAYESCDGIAEKAITSPFDFGTEGLTQTYDCANDTKETSDMGENLYSFALKKGEAAASDQPVADDVLGGMDLMFLSTWGLYNFPSIPHGGTSRGVLQGHLDGGTKDVSLNHTYWIHYNEEEMGDYSVRMFLRGNIVTNLFSLKLARSGGTVGTSIAGYGYAKGTGTYYLFRVTQSYTTGSPNGTGGPRYYCFKSDTTEAEIKAMDGAGSTTIPTYCAAFAANLPAANYDAAPTGTDVPNEVTDFTGKGELGIGLAY